jgi:uridine phosphorylase
MEKIITNDRGAIYHLDVLPQELGDTVILVGDQGRVAQVSQYFDRIHFRGNNREFHWATGALGRKSVTVLSTGIGADNIDIVMNELEALANMDFETHTSRKDRKVLDLLRIGTCGTIQSYVPVGTYCVSQYAIGLDNTIKFYEGSEAVLENPLSDQLNTHLDYGRALDQPYSAAADSLLVNQWFQEEQFIKGMTVSAPGFYGPQGRSRIMSPRFADLYRRLGDFTFQGKQILNFEMEAAPIYAFSKLLGHRAATVCLVLANRITDDFLSDYKSKMDTLIRQVLEGIRTM